MDTGARTPIGASGNWSSGVRALPVAAGTNEGGHYFRYFFPLLVLVLVTLPAFTP